MSARIAIVGGDVYFDVSGDGVRDYSLRLTEAIEASGLAQADLFWWSRSGDWAKTPGNPTAFRSSAPVDIWQVLRSYHAIVLQYDVFRYGQRGFVPWLPLQLMRLKHANPNLRIGIVFHEFHLPFRTWRWELKKAWQNVQHIGFRFAADVLFSTVETWVSELRTRRPHRSTVHLPVASNLPDRRHAREWERVRLGADRNTIVMTAFGTDDSPWRLYDYTVYAVNQVAGTGQPVLFLNLGGNTPNLNSLDESIRVVKPGYISETALAEMIAATDIFLAPFADGISTRRTTVMAALQHGVAVVGTKGMYTDGLLTETPAMRLAPTADPDEFGRIAVQLARAPEQRERLGAAARELYRQCFDWPILAHDLVAALDLPAQIASAPAEVAVQG